MKGCDHKFVDSNVCLKCGAHWTTLQAEAPLDLSDIQARADAATKGPWAAYEMTHYGDPGTGFWNVQPIGEPDDTWSEADAAFIAHARSDIPALLAEVTRLRAQLQDLTSPVRLSPDDPTGDQEKANT